MNVFTKTLSKSLYDFLGVFGSNTCIFDESSAKGSSAGEESPSSLGQGK